MFAVSSVDAAKCYYEELNKLQKEVEKPLKIATIFSFAANEEQNAIGEIAEETFEPTAMNSSAKEFLTEAINDYNSMFKTSYGVESKEFQNYYRDLAKRVKNKEVDLLIVVGMFSIVVPTYKRANAVWCSIVYFKGIFILLFFDVNFLITDFVLIYSIIYIQ